jgi:hypothetical protein
MGQVIHRVGSRPALSAAFGGQLLLLSLLPHVSRPEIFAPFWIVLVSCIATVALALNAQGTRLKEVLGMEVMGRLHGLWSVGALTSGVVAAALADVVPLSWHMAVLMLGVAPIAISLRGRVLAPTDEQSHERAPASESFSAALRPARLTILLTIAATGGSLIEYVSGDWSAIYTREEIGVSLGLSGLSFTAMMLGLTFGRFQIDRLAMRHGIDRVVRAGCLLIAAGVMILAPLASHVVADSRTIALGLTYLGFALVGLGTSGMMPLFLSVIAERSGDTPRSVVLSQMALMQAILIWINKALISVMAESFSITLALMWPALTATIAFALAGLTATRQPGQPRAAR